MTHVMTAQNCIQATSQDGPKKILKKTILLVDI